MFDEADTDFSGRNAGGSSVDGYSSTAQTSTNSTVLNDSFKVLTQKVLV